jgi:hypothetical protein
MTSTPRLPSLFPLLSILAACGVTLEVGGPGGPGGSGGSGASTSTSGNVGSSVTSSSGAGAGHIEPPPPPPTSTGEGGTASATYAISKLYLGDTDRDGTPDKVNGWKQYGFDLDGEISTAQSTGLCKPRNNAAPKQVYPDGFGGIDNSFGRNILPMLLGIEFDFPQKQNDAIASGGFTILFDVVGLGGDPNQSPLVARGYAGAKLGAFPKFDGSDVWPVDPTSLADPASLASAKLQFGQSYLTGNTWVGLAQGEAFLTLDAGPAPLRIPIQHIIVDMTLNSSHDAATNGTIAGVIPLDAFIAEIKKMAGEFDPSLCVGPTIDSIDAQIAQAADIMHDGTQDPTKECDAISIGIGFDARRVQLGPIAPPVSPPPPPCQ